MGFLRLLGFLFFPYRRVRHLSIGLDWVYGDHPSVHYAIRVGPHGVMTSRTSRSCNSVAVLPSQANLCDVRTSQSSAQTARLGIRVANRESALQDHAGPWLQAKPLFVRKEVLNNGSVAV